MNKEKFWENTSPGSAPAHAPSLGPCLVWGKARTFQGYGVVWVDGVQYRAHRFAYIDKAGPIPDGMCIDHLCRNRACCNVSHMEVTTSAENTRRAVPYRSIQRNKRPTADWTAIRTDRASGLTYRQIASKYNMSVSGVYLACNKK